MRGMQYFVSTATVISSISLASGVHAEPVTLRIGTPLAAEHTVSKAMVLFQSEVARRSQSAIDVEFLPDMKLGGPKELVDAVRTGNIFAVAIGIAFISRLVPEADALSLPFVFKDFDHVMRATDGTVGKLMDAKLSAKGFIALAWMPMGARHVTNARRPLKTLDDFKGLKIRLQPSETHMATFRALGASPVAMDFKDLYTAMKQGDIDGQENPYSQIYGYKFYDVQKYLSDTGHILDLIVILANKTTFTSLPPEQQMAIRDAIRTAAVQQRKMAADGEVAAFTALTANGMQFDPLPAATRVALRRATAGVVDIVRKRVGGELVDQVVAAGHR